MSNILTSWAWVCRVLITLVLHFLFDWEFMNCYRFCFKHNLGVLWSSCACLFETSSGYACSMMDAVAHDKLLVKELKALLAHLKSMDLTPQQELTDEQLQVLLGENLGNRAWTWISIQCLKSSTFILWRLQRFCDLQYSIACCARLQKNFGVRLCLLDSSFGWLQGHFMKCYEMVPPGAMGGFPSTLWLERSSKAMKV